jgi:2-phosphoglycerate kinase
MREPDKLDHRPKREAPDLAAILTHVYWLGGTSGAGKSTVARRLAAECELTLYSTDEVMRDHAKRCPPAECPRLHAFLQMSMDERWANRSPEVMFETFPWFHGEGFHLIVEDLLAMPTDRKILVEGFRLLPRLVKPLLGSSRQAVWLISTPEFRLKAFSERGSLWKIPNKTTQPDQALRNHLAREAMFAVHLDREVKAAGVDAIAVDGEQSEDALRDAVRSRFGLQRLPQILGQP